MLARFRKRNRKRFRHQGGGFDIPQNKQSSGTDEALAQHNAEQERAADQQVAANKVGGGRRRKLKTRRRRQVGGEKFTVPQDRNAGENGNASMRNSSEMLAQSQADQKYDAAGGRKRRKTRRKRKRKTKRRKKHYKKRKTKRRRKRR